MIRLILVAIFLVIFFILGFISMIFIYPIGWINKNARDAISYKIVRFAFRYILFVSGTKIIVKGKENIPREESVLFVGNHRSFFDILVTCSMISKKTGYVAKKELGKIFPLNLWMKLINCYFLDRSSIEAAIEMINTSANNIKSGINMFIFPEGTRAKADEEMADFKDGSFKIAKKAKCKIVPVALNNTSAIFEDNFPRIKKSKVCIEFGKPIDLEELSKEDKKAIGAYTRQIVWDMVMNNKNEL